VKWDKKKRVFGSAPILDGWVAIAMPSTPLPPPPPLVAAAALMRYVRVYHIKLSRGGLSLCVSGWFYGFAYMERLWGVRIL
jgi:hypothetical protein